MKCCPSLITICALAIVSAVGASCAYADTTSNANLSIRLGRPLVVRGPESSEIDTSFAEIQTPSGFNGFTANGGTFLLNIAAGTPWAAGGPPIALSETSGANWFIQATPGASAPATTSPFNSCGNWVTGALPQTGQTGGNVWGFVHTEGNAYPSTLTTCPEPKNPDTTSFSIASSTNYGQTWGPLQQIIRGIPTATNQGEGDCTVVDGNDSYYYAYCLRRSDWRTIVARAPKSNPTGPWSKYYQATWSSPGLGGNAVELETLTPPNTLINTLLGTSTGYMTGLNQVALFGVNDGLCPTCIIDQDKNSLRMSLAASDKVTFYPILEPLVPFDPPTDSLVATTPDAWSQGGSSTYGNSTAVNGVRIAKNELYEYPSVMNYTNASNQLLNGFLLTHMYIEPGDNYNARHLVFRDLTVTVSSTPVVPQVGIALSRWVNSTVNDNWTTTAPVPCNYSTTYSPTSAAYCTHGYYAYDKLLGYLMTQPHPTLPTNKIEDCVNQVNNLPANAFPGHLDHMLAPDQTCVKPGTSYIRLRTAGWVYQSQQPNTVPLYRCWNPSISQHFVSNQSNCEGNGNMEFMLGYALAN